MKSPDAPDSMPQPMLQPYAPPLGLPEGAGPEQLEYTRARAAALANRLAEPKGTGTLKGAPRRPVRTTTGGVVVFQNRPAIAQDITEAASGAGSSTPASLPGRVAPTVWDGEPGANAPTVSGG